MKNETETFMLDLNSNELETFKSRVNHHIKDCLIEEQSLEQIEEISDILNSIDELGQHLKGEKVLKREIGFPRL